MKFALTNTAVEHKPLTQKAHFLINVELKLRFMVNAIYNIVLHKAECLYQRGLRLEYRIESSFPILPECDLTESSTPRRLTLKDFGVGLLRVDFA